MVDFRIPILFQYFMYNIAKFNTFSRCWKPISQFNAFSILSIPRGNPDIRTCALLAVDTLITREAVALVCAVVLIEAGWSWQIAKASASVCARFFRDAHIGSVGVFFEVVFARTSKFSIAKRPDTLPRRTLGGANGTWKKNCVILKDHMLKKSMFIYLAKSVLEMQINN